MSGVLAGAPINASDVNRTVGKSVATADSAATNASTGAEIVVDTVTATVIAGRPYTIESYFPQTGTVVNDRYFVLIREGTTIAGAQLTYATATITQTGQVEVTRPKTPDWVAPSSGTVSFCVCVRRAAGTGSLQPRASSGQPRWLAVEAAW